MDLREILDIYDMKPRDLTRETGLCQAVIKSILKGSPPTPKSRFLIESAFKQPIWSTPEEFKERERIRSLFKCEPCSLSKKQLRHLARIYNIRYQDPKYSDCEALTLAIADAIALRQTVMDEYLASRPEIAKILASRKATIDKSMFRTEKDGL